MLFPDHSNRKRCKKKGIGFTLRDNAFTEIADWNKAQKLADKFDPASLHRRLDQLAATYCPVVERLGATYHWSLVQVEYSTDIVFRHQSDLETIVSFRQQCMISWNNHALLPKAYDCSNGLCWSRRRIRGRPLCKATLATSRGTD